MPAHAALVAAAGEFSWDLLGDWQQITGYEFMRHALVAGGVAAVLCGVVGYFVVLRGLSFATDTLTHVGFAGASGAAVVGISPVVGLLGLTAAMAGVLGGLERRLRGRDVVVGMVLVLTLGLGILLLRFYRGNANEAYALLFGNVLALNARDVDVIVAGAAVALAALTAIYRPLLLSSLDEDLAEARGLPVRLLAVGYLLVLAVAVSAATQVIGALLAVALLIAPAAMAHRLSGRPLVTVPLAALIAVAMTWTGLAVAFWQPYPVSFFVTALTSLGYLGVRLLTRSAATGGRPPAVEA